VAVVLGLVALSVCWFLVFHAWWLNSDGSTYLGTGRSVLDGHGFRLPDGVTLAWWNRPVYPVVIALPSLVRGGFGGCSGGTAEGPSRAADLSDQAPQESRRGSVGHRWLAQCGQLSKPAGGCGTGP
jgi:hypothetical protein